MKFDFNEANILKQNLFLRNDTKEILIHRISNLVETTNDEILKSSVLSLIQKIEMLSNEEIKNIHSDIISKKFIATTNYDYGK